MPRQPTEYEILQQLQATDMKQAQQQQQQAQLVGLLAATAAACYTGALESVLKEASRLDLIGWSYSNEERKEGYRQSAAIEARDRAVALLRVIGLDIQIHKPPTTP